MARNKTETPGRPTIYDVAREVGFSPATVSRALAGSPAVGPDTSAAILQAAERLGFRPNALARRLSTQRSRTVGMLVPDITNPYFPMLIRHLQRQAQTLGYDVLFCDTDDDPDAELRFLESLISQQVRCAITIGLQLDAKAVASVVAQGLRIVTLDREAEHVSGLTHVGSNNRAGAIMAVNYLVGLGHNRIAHISGPRKLNVATERARGYRSALAKAGIPIDDRLILEADFSDRGGAEALAALMQIDDPPTAIFASDDVMAIGAISAATDLGLRVPKDLSIVGFDDIPIASLLRPKLTTVRQDVPKLAQRAFLAAVGDEPQRNPPHIPVTLVERKSARPPSRNQKSQTD
ncbi:MAG: LacI family DNA-binding transcriptional regulator [Propionibacteriaceae bacterium]|nr:LacI family DNA-binding transcriptional regulator [Propionibacteriaceae bacterium]